MPKAELKVNQAGVLLRAVGVCVTEQVTHAHSRPCPPFLFWCLIPHPSASIFKMTPVPPSPPQADIMIIDSHTLQAAKDPRGQPLHFTPQATKGLVKGQPRGHIG